MLKRVGLALLGSVCLAPLGTGAVAAFPEKPITIIVPAGPGGPTDIGVRTWVPFMEECLGTSLVVINRPGGGHVLGLTEIAAAEPDGYTIGTIVLPTMAIGAIKATFTADSFDYLGSFYGGIATVVVRNDSEITSLQQLVDETKQSGKPFKFGMASFASDDHMVALQFAKEADIEIEYVPLGDSAPTRNAVLGGHIQVAMLAITDVLPFKDQLRVLAIAAAERTPDIPDAPTYTELGFNVIGGSSHIMGGPKGMPDEAKAKLASCFESVAKDQAFIDEATKRAMVLKPRTSEEATEFVNTSYDTVMELWKSDPWE